MAQTESSPSKSPSNTLNETDLRPEFNQIEEFGETSLLLGNAEAPVNYTVRHIQITMRTTLTRELGTRIA
jgi:hypothetical protein